MNIEHNSRKSGFDPIFDSIAEVLALDDRVIFAYLYGSAVNEEKANDIDIAVFSAEKIDPHALSADLKIALHKKTGLPPETFDISILNHLLEKADLFDLHYLKNVLQNNLLLVDNSPDIRTDFLEQYGYRYRECEGLFQEVML